MLNWEECAALVTLSQDEQSTLGGPRSAGEFIDFVMAPYLYDEPLKDRPGVRDCIRDDIAAARQRGTFDLAALFELGLRQRLMAQGYAGELPPLVA